MADTSEFKVCLSGTMPNEDVNGWADEAFAEFLDSDRAKTRYALVAYNVQSAKEVTATGKRILTVQLQRVEPIPDRDASVAEQEINTRREARTGQATLFPPGGSND